MEVKKLMLSAPWCSNCEIMKPIIREMGGIEIINIEDHPEVAERYGAMSLPAFIVDSGEFKIKFGVMPKKLLEEFYG